VVHPKRFPLSKSERGKVLAVVQGYLGYSDAVASKPSVDYFIEYFYNAITSGDLRRAAFLLTLLSSVTPVTSTLLDTRVARSPSWSYDFSFVVMPVFHILGLSTLLYCTLMYFYGRRDRIMYYVNHTFGAFMLCSFMFVPYYIFREVNSNIDSLELREVNDMKIVLDVFLHLWVAVVLLVILPLIHRMFIWFYICLYFNVIWSIFKYSDPLSASYRMVWILNIICYQSLMAFLYNPWQYVLPVMFVAIYQHNHWLLKLQEIVAEMQVYLNPEKPRVKTVSVGGFCFDVPIVVAREAAVSTSRPLLMSRVSGSHVVITSDDDYVLGGGVCYATGCILTAYHVVSNYQTIYVHWKSSFGIIVRTPVHIKWFDEVRDVAVLSGPLIRTCSLKVPEVGITVSMLGDGTQRMHVKEALTHNSATSGVLLSETLHSITTTYSDSGKPLMFGSHVVGVHIGRNVKNINEFCMITPSLMSHLLTLCDRKHEGGSDYNDFQMLDIAGQRGFTDSDKTTYERDGETYVLYKKQDSGVFLEFKVGTIDILFGDDNEVHEFHTLAHMDAVIGGKYDTRHMSNKQRDHVNTSRQRYNARRNMADRGNKVGKGGSRATHKGKGGSGFKLQNKEDEAQQLLIFDPEETFSRKLRDVVSPEPVPIVEDVASPPVFQRPAETEFYEPEHPEAELTIDDLRKMYLTRERWVDVAEEIDPESDAWKESGARKEVSPAPPPSWNARSMEKYDDAPDIVITDEVEAKDDDIIGFTTIGSGPKRFYKHDTLTKRTDLSVLSEELKLAVCDAFPLAETSPEMEQNVMEQLMSERPKFDFDFAPWLESWSMYLDVAFSGAQPAEILSFDDAVATFTSDGLLEKAAGYPYNVRCTCGKSHTSKGMVVKCPEAMSGLRDMFDKIARGEDITQHPDFAPVLDTFCKYERIKKSKKEQGKTRIVFTNYMILEIVLRALFHKGVKSLSSTAENTPLKIGINIHAGGLHRLFANLSKSIGCVVESDIRNMDSCMSGDLMKFSFNAVSYILKISPDNLLLKWARGQLCGLKEFLINGKLVLQKEECFNNSGHFLTGDLNSFALIFGNFITYFKKPPNSREILNYIANCRINCYGDDNLSGFDRKFSKQHISTSMARIGLDCPIEKIEVHERKQLMSSIDMTMVSGCSFLGQVGFYDERGWFFHPTRPEKVLAMYEFPFSATTLSGEGELSAVLSLLGNFCYDDRKPVSFNGSTISIFDGLMRSFKSKYPHITLPSRAMFCNARSGKESAFVDFKTCICDTEEFITPLNKGKTQMSNGFDGREKNDSIPQRSGPSSSGDVRRKPPIPRAYMVGKGSGRVGLSVNDTVHKSSVPSISTASIKRAVPLSGGVIPGHCTVDAVLSELKCDRLSRAELNKIDKSIRAARKRGGNTSRKIDNLKPNAPQAKAKEKEKQAKTQNSSEDGST
jgi:hypothetical protein